TRAHTSPVNYFCGKTAQLKVADSSVPADDRGYFYDGASNLNRRTNNGVTSSFFVNVRNQVTNAPSPVLSVIYDLNGNTRTNHSGQWVYAYDGEHRLSSLTR